MRKLKLILHSVSLLLCVVMYQCLVRAAPPVNYEGFGAVTRGALDAPGGYTTYHVTSLNNAGAGTFRDAVSQGSRYIVFDVGGTITLTGSLEMPHSYITIDGSTAPSPGITIKIDGHTSIEPNSGTGPGHDIIVHHLRLQGSGYGNGGDLFGLYGGRAPLSNVIIDHVTAISAGDGIFDTTGVVSDVTLSWNLMMDTELCTLIKYGGIERISLHHNVFARNAERQASVSGDVQLMDYVNNVVYGWDYRGGLRIVYQDGVINPSINVENNVFHLVINGFYDRPSDAFLFGRGPDEGDVYINGNIAPVESASTGSVSGRLPIPAYAEVTKYAASTLGDTVVPFAGTQYPTQEEQDLLNEISIAIGGQGIPQPNQPPQASAGDDQTLTDSDNNGSEQVAFDGSGSTDPDGSIVSYMWGEDGSQIAAGVNPTVHFSTGTHTVTLTVTDNGGLTDTDEVIIIIESPQQEEPIEPEDTPVPTKTEIKCYNNVFTPSKGEEATIHVELDTQAQVTVVIYDNKGKKIKTVVDEEKTPGFYTNKWNGKDDSGNSVGSGIYIVHIEAGGYTKTKKIAVVK